MQYLRFSDGLTGMTTPNPFDQMQTASMLGGPYASIRATPPASSLYLTAGTGPYTGFYYAVEVSWCCEREMFT